MDKKYWENIYNKQDAVPSEPSAFALFIVNMLVDQKEHNIHSIVDLGCGNGRDSYYLAKYSTVVGIDLATKPDDKTNVTFLQQSMDDIEGQHDLMYMRFSLHSIPEEVEEKVLNHAMKNCKYVAIEARSTSDKLSGGKGENSVETSYASKHYRRYIDKEIIVSKLKDRGFNILHVSESDTYAKYKGTSPTCVRVVACIS